MSEDGASAVYWPIGTRGESVIVVRGEEDARHLAPVLIDERPDPDDPEAGTVVAALPMEMAKVPAEQLALEIRTAGIESVWLTAPASEDTRRYCEELSGALVDAGLFPACYAPLPPDWQLTDILAELSPQRGLLYEILHAFWLTGGPPLEQLKLYVRELAKGVE